MVKYIISHDLGTSGNKASLFSDEGKLIGSFISSYDTYYIGNNYVEQNAERWWEAICETTQNLIKNFKIDENDIAVVSFSGQMMGCLCVDVEGNPLRNSIIWADQRAQKQALHIEKYISQEEFYQIVGHKNTPSYGIQKLMWIKDNEPEIYEKTYKMLNAKDFIVSRLTGNFYTDYSDGNSTGCFDLKNLKWSSSIIEYSGIDKDKLPELKPSTYIAGKVTKEASKATGLNEGTPVVLGAGDGVTASVGAGSISPGRTYCSLGTSAWITTTTKEPIYDESMRTVTWAHAVPGLYAPNGTMQTAGGALSWFKNELCKTESLMAEESGRSFYDIINKEVMQSPAGSNGIYFLPYLLGERAPRWDVNAKGAFIGLKTENERKDIIRSIMEGVTFNLGIILDVLRMQIDINELIVVGGGAKSSIWNQVMADVFDTEIKVPEVLEEASSMGAAIIGGVGVGLFDDFDVIDKFININVNTTPDESAVSIYKENKEIFDEAYYALKPVFEKMSEKK